MSDDKIIDDIGNHIGGITEHWGLSSTPGRAWMAIYFLGPITQDELKKRLKCSSGAISQALTLLANFSMIEISGKQGRKKLYTATAPAKAKRRHLEYLLQFQVQPMRQLLDEKIKDVKDAHVKEKLKDLDKLSSRMEKGLQWILKLPFGK